VAGDREERVREARLLAGLGRRQEAETLLDGVLAEDPQHSGALLVRAGLHAEDRDWDRAHELYERVARAAPRSAEARNELARCLHALGRDDEALEEARAAQSVLNEGENFRFVAPVYLTLVWCLRELGRYREALALAEEGLERAPDAILAQWATQVEAELAAAEKEQC
jgi:tetratricopeptide (TPR) repeat protein